MQKLHLVGFTTDQKGLILSARRGARSGSFHLSVDQDLADAVEKLRAKQVEEEAELREEAEQSRPARVESALSVKEIQARLRQGRSVADVAKAAGVDADWIERFAAPVFAERAQVISRVRSSHLRRARLGPSEHTIDEAIRRNLADRGVAISPEEVAESWSARQLADGRWAVRFRYRHRNRDHHVRFDLDDGDGDESVTAADRASSQLAYITPSAPPPPRPPRRPPEPTVPPMLPRGPKRATVSTGFRPDDGAATSRAARERERANDAMRKAALQAAAEAERAAARRAKEREIEAARREKAAKAEEARKERERLAAERKRVAAAKKKAAAAKKRAADRAKAKAAKQAADQARRAEAALRAAERREAARRKEAARAAEAASRKASSPKRSPSTTKAPARKKPAPPRSATKKASTEKAPAKKKAAARKAPARKAPAGTAKKPAVKKGPTKQATAGAPVPRSARTPSPKRSARAATKTASPKKAAPAKKPVARPVGPPPVAAATVRVPEPAPTKVTSAPKPVVGIDRAVNPPSLGSDSTGDVRILGPVASPARPSATFRTELVESAEAPPARLDPSPSPNGRARERSPGERRTRPLRAN